MSRREQLLKPSDWRPRRVLVTGYYDGPTEGIIDFGNDIGVFCFKAIAFDFDREMRVLKLVRVASEQLEAILTSLTSALGPPKWPFWVPIWNSEDEDVRRSTAAELDTFCAAGEAVMAVLTDEAIEQCFAVREIDERSESVVKDWLSFFRDSSS
jgi:hypothetical protein